MFPGGYLMMTIHNADPVEYLFYRSQKEGPSGYTVPGWYFWDEIWCDVYGPYESVEKTQDALSRYAKEELGL